MAGRTVVVRLNQQQIELIDRTIQRGEAPDRVSPIRKALLEQARKRRSTRVRSRRELMHPACVVRSRAGSAPA
jgi:Arc/MetJ-type ribon-helix-helix transcriptional regulator